jgi:EpsI family protein
VYGYLAYRSLARRLVFVGFSIVVPVVANWLRAYMIVMIGHLSGNRLAVGVDHFIYGWVFFGVVMLLLFWAASHWREDDPVAPAAAPAIDAGAPESATRVLAVALAAVALASIWRPLPGWIEARAPSGPIALAPIVAANGWVPAPSPSLPFRPDYDHASAETTQAFRNGDAEVGVFVAYYRNQSQDRELVGHHNQIARTTNPVWVTTRAGYADARVGNDPQRVRTSELRGGGRRLVAWHWYWIDGRLTTSDAAAKLYLALAKLQGRGDDSAAIVIFTAAGESTEAAGRVLDRFAADMGGSIGRMLQDAERP